MESLVEFFVPLVSKPRNQRFDDGSALERDEFDLVAVGRALLQDPEWVVKVRDGRENELKSFERSAMGVLY